MEKYRQAVEYLLLGTGIKINGKNPWDIRVYNSNFYKRVLTQGSLGLGESYMEEWWDCERLDEFLYRLFTAGLEEKVKNDSRLKWMVIKAKLVNRQSKIRAKRCIESHYNIGNKLYEKMLDPLMIYSCGYWQEAENLSEAQEHKLELICRKLKLKPKQKVLDIGCGWGGFAWYAAKNYGVKVVGITISREQYNLASKRCEGLPVEIRLQDYRDLNERFDRIVSIGMLEHVGHKNFPVFMHTVYRNLKKEGLCLLHFIGGIKTSYATDPWIDKYIFPGGVIPSISQIGKAMEKRLVLEDWHNFGLYYDKTLMAWLENFRKAWPQLKEDYSDIFYRMWEFYLCASAASFRSRRLQLWQLVITRKDFSRFYTSVRPTKLKLQKVD